MKLYKAISFFWVSPREGIFVLPGQVFATDNPDSLPRQVGYDDWKAFYMEVKL